MSNPALPRASEKSVTISVGLASTKVSLHPMKDTSGSREIKTVLLDDAGHKVSQTYQCSEGTCTYPAGQQGFKTGDLTKRGREVGTDVIVLTAEELKDAKGSKLPKNILDLSVSPASEVDSATWPSGVTYWMQPETPDAFYLGLCTKVADLGTALIGLINLRGTDKLVRLLPHANGGLVMQELLRPSETYRFEAVEGVIADKYVTMLGQLFDAVTVPFDDDAFESTAVAAHRALIAERSGGVPLASVKPIKGAAPAVDSTEAMLAAALAMAVAAKAAA